MRRIPLISLPLTLLLITGVLHAQQLQEDPEEGETEVLPDFPVPSTPQELLGASVGLWDLTIRVWSSPDGEPVETVGSAESRWILGQRFVQTLYQGEVMERPFEGLRIEGYEKATEEYVSTWRDNLGTYTLVFRGRCPDSCRARTMMSSFLDPVSKLRLSIKGVTTLTGVDSYTYESFIRTPDGTEFKNMELAAHRRTP